MTTTSLLSTLRANPGTVFSDWLSTQDLGASSIRVYSSMFSKFSLWLSARGGYLDQCSEDDIEAFLDAHHLEKEHRYRYVRLIERFFHYLTHVHKLRTQNPGSIAARDGVGRGDNDLMHFLSTAQYTAIADYISRRSEEKTEKIEKQKSSRHWTSFTEWREARDRALAGAMLFGAVRVEEVAVLSVNCITRNERAADSAKNPDMERLAVKSIGRVPYHEALLLPQGLASLTLWLASRRHHALPGTVLFPSDDLGEPMHPASIYRRVRRVIENAFETAGLELNESRLSPQTLRNTYAGMLIDCGYPDRVIMDCMGIKALTSMMRIRAFYKRAQQ